MARELCVVAIDDSIFQEVKLTMPSASFEVEVRETQVLSRTCDLRVLTEVQ